MRATLADPRSVGRATLPTGRTCGLTTRADEAGLGSSSLILLYGELGAGKTHACMWARHKILYSEEGKQFNSVAYYINKLRVDEKVSFAAAFERDIVSKNNVAKDVTDYRQFLDEVIVEFRHHHGAGLKKEDVIERLIPSYDLSVLAKQIVNCQDHDAVLSVLSSPRGADYKAVSLFTGLIKLFVLPLEIQGKIRRHKNGAYLFIDELNILADASAKEGRQINEMIRTIYDECSSSFCFILAFTASVAAVGNLFDEWVIDRVSRQIVMQTLPQNEAMEFITGILDTQRADPDLSKGRTGYFPFDMDAVKDIVSEMSSITPRRLMKAMERVIEACRRAGADPTSGRISSQFLQDNGIMDEISSVPL